MKAVANLYKRKAKRQRNNKEKKKKKMKMMNRGSNDDDVEVDISNNPPIIISSSLHLDDDIVVFEILSRLPVKSLMRFKSVCKRWRSLIQRDPHFHDLHLTRSKTVRPALLFLFPLQDNSICLFGLRECFLSAADLFEGRAAIHTIRKTDSLVYGGILKPVNGLICFHGISHDVRIYSHNTREVTPSIKSTIINSDGVCIYNPSTREVTPWIKSTIRKEEKDSVGHYPTYDFGFDPSTKEHKVICIWTIYKPTACYACEILTVGQNSWRRIDEVPPYDIKGASVYANGSIYWFNKILHKYDKWDNGDPEVIVAFDVGSEKFRAIPVPDFIFDQPPDRDEHRGPSVELLEVGGRLALMRRMNGYTVKLWKINGTTSTFTTSTSKRNNWTEVTITLPFCWDRNVDRLSFHGFAGTDQLILRSIGIPGWLVSLYSYNWKKQTFKKVEISGISSIADPCSYTLFTPFVESLLPVSSSSSTTTLSLHLESETAFSTQELRSPSNPLLS